MERTNLLLAAGHSREKKLYLEGDREWRGKLVTVDINPECGADVVFDLSLLGAAPLVNATTGAFRLPFPDNTFDEIHAYDCLEHWGAQGDWRAWFREMAEYHRLLKPGGIFAAIVPIGDDRFADPGHTRFMSLNYFLFLHQGWYDHQRQLGTSAADYRWFWKLDFEPVAANTMGEPPHHLGVLIRKPHADVIEVG